MNLKELITTVPDFPKKGVNFRDITTLTRDPAGFAQAVHGMTAGPWRHLDQETSKFIYDFDVVLSAEARGFIFGPPIALMAGAGFVPARKSGKLPGQVISSVFVIEYARRSIEIRTDQIKPGDRVLLVDDVIATGGTLKGMADLVERCGGTVAGVSALIELTDLGGRAAITEKYHCPVQALVYFTEDE